MFFRIVGEGVPGVLKGTPAAPFSCSLWRRRSRPRHFLLLSKICIFKKRGKNWRNNTRIIDDSIFHKKMSGFSHFSPIDGCWGWWVINLCVAIPDWAGLVQWSQLRSLTAMPHVRLQFLPPQSKIGRPGNSPSDHRTVCCCSTLGTRPPLSWLRAWGVISSATPGLYQRHPPTHVWYLFFIEISNPLFFSEMLP